jgi:hypothetical protein
MKRPAVLIVALVTGALLVVVAGASARTAILIVRSAGTHAAASHDEASGARTESTEPEESPEAAPTAEPTERPEPTEAPEPAENENDADEDNDENHDNDNDEDAHEGEGGGDD